MINFYLLGYKGLVSLKGIDSDYFRLINQVIVGVDKNVINDYSLEIIDFCKRNGLDYIVQNKESLMYSEFSIAIGWRWLISGVSRLIVFHDSILPRLRGFNPLVTALINGDREIGVSVLFATEEYDKGDIIIQQKIDINYPCKINQAIEKVSQLYSLALNKLLKELESGIIKGVKQDDCLATYSLWRDEDDYRIDWCKSASYLRRFIDAVGFPYKGAYTFLNEKKLIIKDVIEEKDVIIENREPGKIIFKNGDKLFVVCGEGILSIKEFFSEDGHKTSINNFRSRFK